MKNFAICLVVGLTVLLSGCNPEPVEGRKAYNQTWTKATVKEKMLYAKVTNAWNKNHFIYVREAIRSRSSKPGFNAIPFADIASIIILNNNIELIIKNSWSVSVKSNADNCKWENINPAWYAQLVAIANGTAVDCILPVNAANIPLVTIMPETVEEAVVVDAQDIDNLLNYDEYDMLVVATSSCKPAKDLLSDIYQVKKFLTVSDREQIMQKVLYCKSLELEASINN